MRKKMYEITLKNAIETIGADLVAKGVITRAELDGSTKVEGSTDKFIDLVADSSAVLSRVGYQNMGDQKKFKLNTFELDPFVLQTRPTAGSSLVPANGSEAEFNAPTLDASDMIAFAVVSKEAVEENIAGASVIDLFSSKLATKAGKNMLQMFYFGDSTVDLTGATGTELRKRTLYKKQDGWIKKAGKKIYAAASEFDETNIADVLDKLEFQIEDDYIDRSKMAYILNRAQFTAFQAMVATLHPNTSVGVDATTNRKAFYYNDIEVIEDLALASYLASSVTGGTGEVAILARMDSLFYGMPEALLSVDSWYEKKDLAYYVTNEMFPANTLAIPDAVAVAFYTAAKPA